MALSTPPFWLAFRTSQARKPTQYAPARSTSFGWKRTALPWRSATTIFGLSNSHSRAQPPKYAAARARLRKSEWTERSKTNSPHIARLQESNITKSHKGR